MTSNIRTRHINATRHCVAEMRRTITWWLRAVLTPTTPAKGA